MSDPYVGADYGAQLRSERLSSTAIYRAIGRAEGTIDANGQPTSAYYGHGDPGNGALNRGFGSYQVYQDPRGEALTAAQADRIQAARLAEQWNGIDAALERAGFKPGPQRDLIAASALDAWNQAPEVLGGHYGLLNPKRLEWLATGLEQGKPVNESIANWRANAYYNDQGTLLASGFDNDFQRLKDDQLRRVGAVADALHLAPARTQTAAPPPGHATPAAPKPHDVGAEIARTARAWADHDYKPGQTEKCQDFVNHVLDQTRPGLTKKIGTTQHAVDGLFAGELLASRFAGRDVSQPVAGLAQARPGDIVCFTNTYGNWPAGTITHVGIYVGNGQIVDRPTADRPVQLRSIDTFGAGNYQIFRPNAYGQTLSQSAVGNGAPRAANDPALPTHGLLMHGDRGPDTEALQKALKALNIKGQDGRPLAVDGDFGDNTQWAVKTFQRMHGLEIDGKAGEHTLAALAHATKPLHDAPHKPEPPPKPVAPGESLIAEQRTIPPAANAGTRAQFDFLVSALASARPGESETALGVVANSDQARQLRGEAVAQADVQEKQAAAQIPPAPAAEEDAVKRGGMRLA